MELLDGRGVVRAVIGGRLNGGSSARLFDAGVLPQVDLLPAADSGLKVTVSAVVPVQG